MEAFLVPVVLGGILLFNLVLCHKKDQQYVGYGWRLSYKSDTKTVVVKTCHPGSPAAREEVKEGAVVLAFAGHILPPMPSRRAFIDWTKRIAPQLGEQGTFIIREGSTPRTVVLTAEVIPIAQMRHRHDRSPPSQHAVDELFTHGGMASREQDGKTIIAATRRLKQDVVEAA